MNPREANESAKLASCSRSSSFETVRSYMLWMNQIETHGRWALSSGSRQLGRQAFSESPPQNIFLRKISLSPGEATSKWAILGTSE